MKTKGGVTQWDIAADFQTKQLASRMIGYYTVNGPTHGTKLNIDYQFYGNPKQNIKLEALYSERPMAYRHDLYAELSMEFTAYPGYNFYSIIRNVVSCNLDLFVLFCNGSDSVESLNSASLKNIMVRLKSDSIISKD